MLPSYFPVEASFYNKGAAYSKVQVSMAVGVDRNKEPTHDNCFTEKLFWKCAKDSEENVSDGLQFSQKLHSVGDMLENLRKQLFFQHTSGPLDNGPLDR